MEFLKKVPSIRFMALRRYWYVLSAAVVVGSIVLVMVRGLNLTVDFTGGLVFEIGFTQPVDLERARAALADAGIEDAQVRSYGAASDLEVRLPPAETGAPADQSGRVLAALRTLDPAVELRRTDSVGPQVSRQLGEQAALAVLMTLLLVLVYIALRFRWRFGVGSLVASLHDPIVAVGAIALLGIPFDLNVVAALLTILGYSVNDTVVIFDRIRERFKSMRKAVARGGHRPRDQRDAGAHDHRLRQRALVGDIPRGPGRRDAARIRGRARDRHRDRHLFVGLRRRRDRARSRRLGPRLHAAREARRSRRAAITRGRRTGNGVSRRSGSLDRIPDADAARDRPRHRQHHLPVDPGLEAAARAPAARPRPRPRVRDDHAHRRCCSRSPG